MAPGGDRSDSGDRDNHSDNQFAEIIKQHCGRGQCFLCDKRTECNKNAARTYREHFYQDFLCSDNNSQCRFRKCESYNSCVNPVKNNLHEFLIFREKVKEKNLDFYHSHNIDSKKIGG